MNAREWKRVILEILNGVERQLRPSAPKRARALLAEFRVRLSALRCSSDRRRYEVELEKFLESAPYLREAAWRYLTPKVVDALKTATEAAKLASSALAEYAARKT